MSGWTVEWEPAALDAAAGFMHEDLPGIHMVFNEVEHLAANPNDPAWRYWTSELVRLRVGAYRVLGDIQDGVLHINRLSRRVK